jgi:hypothetical protein
VQQLLENFRSERHEATVEPRREECVLARLRGIIRRVPTDVLLRGKTSYFAKSWSILSPTHESVKLQVETLSFFLALPAAALGAMVALFGGEGERSKSSELCRGATMVEM